MAVHRTWSVLVVAVAALVTAASCSSSPDGPPPFVSQDSGKDCGGRTGNACGDGEICEAPSDCQSRLCKARVCVAPPPGCEDGQKDNDETDVDCGGSACATCLTGKECRANADCASDACVSGLCEAPTFTDGLKNDSESDVDCGGGFLTDGHANPLSDGAPACFPGEACVLPSDCLEGVCAVTRRTGEGHAKIDAGAMKDAHEDDASKSPGKGPLTCQAASPSDGVKNATETDVDCGGQFLATGDRNPASDGAAPCGHAKTCQLGTDCAEKVCNDNHDKGGGPVDCPVGKACTCQVPWANDGAQNDSETDVDCGGGTTLASDGAPPCGSNLHCNLKADCVSHVCAGGLCSPPSPTDGVLNDSETDVDCGGATLANGNPNPASDSAPGCADEQTCALDTDCLSRFCSLISHTCVDGQSCKGVVPPAQILDISVEASTTPGGADAVGVPDANGIGQSAGLDTCGVGESTDPLASQKHESCCRSLLLPGSTTVRLDKYVATAGRIRQFLQALNYDVRDWAIAQFDASWNPLTPAGTTLSTQLPVNQPGTTNVLTLLPHSNDVSEPLNAVIQTGAIVMDQSGVQGCFTNVGAGGAATYWWDSTTIFDQASSPPRPFTQDYYDIKPMNCIPYMLAVAFCAWDGGRMMMQPEHALVWGPQAMPWGPAMIPVPYPGNTAITSDPACAGGAVTCTVDWFNGGQGVGSQGNFYFYPGAFAANPNANVADSISNILDLSPYIAAPGRFYLDVTTAVSPSFAGNEGWQDLGANMLEHAPGTTPLTGTQSFCDESGPLAPGEAYNCSADPTAGIIRGTGLPATTLLGGSWEGHGPAETYGTDDWSIYRQYGKLGVRCARPAE